jgi:hypothetical protein
MARSRNAILEALAQIGNSELSSEHIPDFFKEIGAVDNHRGAALLLATHLEDALQFALINRLKINHKRFNDIFGYDAPMGTFDRKVRVAHAIGMITDETRLTLDVIRRIRNAFAHALIPISFNTPQVTNACSLLKIPLPFPPTSSPASGAQEKEESAPSPRRRYQRTCDVISHNLLVVSGAYVALTRTQPPFSA